MAHKSLACSARTSPGQPTPREIAPVRLPAAAASVQASVRDHFAYGYGTENKPSSGGQDRASPTAGKGSTSRFLTCLWPGFKTQREKLFVRYRERGSKSAQIDTLIHSEEVDHARAFTSSSKGLRFAQAALRPALLPHPRAEQLSQGTGHPGGREGERAGLALVTPNRRFKDKLRNRHPVGRSVGRLGPEGP